MADQNMRARRNRQQQIARKTERRDQWICANEDI